MKSTGIVRRIDRLGRIVIPMEVRRVFNIDSMDPLEISVDKNKIIITKFAHSCIFCGSKKNLNIFKEKKICSNCFNSLKEYQ